MVNRQERTADAGIHRDEPFVLLPPVVLPQYLSYATDIEARILPLHNLDIGPVRHHARRIRLAIEHEQKVCPPM